ncbi:MAG: Ig-like domain-containing protein [Bacteroidales bacterium]|nr:Ig-like domain-containing protein [Bacteroidales bacterium]
MKRINYILAALIMMLAGSCSRMEENIIGNDPVQGSKLTFKATNGDNPETKTVRQDDGSIWWSKNDAINVFCGNAKGQFTTDISAPAATASFTGTLEGDAGDASVYWGVYPYNESNSFDGTGVTLTIPPEQKGVPGTFADKLNPSVARSETESLSFYNVGSWFVFTVAGEGITSATFKGNNDETIAGKVKVTMDSEGKPVAEVLEGVKAITITPEDGGSFTPDKKYRIVLLPQTMEKGYTITLYKGNQSTDCTVTKESAFERSKFRGKHTVDSGNWHGEYIDMGEGQLWATMNIGATSETEVGSYFAWGETESKASYGWDNYAWGENETGLTKYVLQSSYGTVDNLSVLVPSDDAATAAWGEGWRTPTMTEWMWLYDNCDKSIETVDGVTGFRYTSRIEGYTSNSIFIPEAKYYDGLSLVEGESKVSYYWSSSLNSVNSGYAQSMGLSQTYDILNGTTPKYRYQGLPVRAVCIPPIPVTGINLNKSSISMELGDTPITLGATVSPENATNQTILWSSSDESIAGVNINGNVCNVYPAGVGTATITAKTADGGYTATCRVTVTGVPTTGVTLDKTSLILSPGERYVLTATVLPSNASVKTVRWSSSNPTDVYVSESGEVIALAENGSSIITVTTDYGGYTATCEVTVVYVPVTSVTLDKTSLTLPIGESYTSTATTYPADASNPVVNWSTSDESVATVDYNGTITAVEDCRGGTATITASCEGGTVTASCVVTVTVPVTEVVLYTDELSLVIGSTFQLEASVRPIYATNQNILWSSSDESVASVNSNGLVTALKIGSTIISAISEDGRYIDNCWIYVNPAEINGHAYVEMGVTSADGKVLKWATMNVGATSETDYGDYFAWGETTPYYSSLEPLTWKDGKSAGYAWESYFDTNDNGSTFTKYKYTGDNIMTLESEDDAATVNWGSTWRMPTYDEWTQLWKKSNFTWEWDSNRKGVTVTSKMEGYVGNQIFLPAAGYWNGTYLSGAGSGGYSWSTSLYESYSDRARRVYFYSGGVLGNYSARCYGLTVRPVSE